MKELMELYKNQGKLHRKYAYKVGAVNNAIHSMSWYFMADQNGVPALVILLQKQKNNYLFVLGSSVSLGVLQGSIVGPILFLTYKMFEGAYLNYFCSVLTHDLL